jgi:chemotaxis protein MotB
MWLLAISSQAGKAALADYFANLTMYDAVFNGGLPSTFDPGGASILDGGCFSPKSDGDDTKKSEGDKPAKEKADGGGNTQNQNQAALAALMQTTQDLMQHLDSLPAGADGGEGSGDAGRSDAVSGQGGGSPGGPGGDQEGGEGPLNADQQQFADQLHAAVEGSLGDEAAGQVFVEKVKGGLRVQIVDKDGRPMFQSGGPALTETAKGILDVVAARLKDIPNKISIEGHTDSLTFAGQRFTNWELSTARASATRVYLATKDVQENRLTAVTGYAATQPLDKENPQDPINRRISVMIWDEESKAPPLPAVPPTPGNTPDSSATPLPADAVPSASRGPAPQPNAPLLPTNATAVPGQAGGPANGSPPSLPRPPRPAKTAPLTPDELERRLVETTMEKAAVPDLSTVGPPVSMPDSPPQ